MKTFILFMVLVMPDGEVVTAYRFYEDACPARHAVEHRLSKMKRDGDLKSYSYDCVKLFAVPGKEA